MSITRIEVPDFDELKRISQMSERKIEELENWRDEYDEDCPPSTPEELAQFKRVNPIKKEKVSG